MERQCRTRARRPGPQGRRASAVVLLLLLVLLLLRPAGKPRPAPRPSPPGPHRPRLTPLRPSAGRLADQTPGTPSKPAPADPGVPCAPTATCPSGGPRLPRQAPTVPSPPLTLQTSPVSKEGISLFPSEYHGLPGGGGCGAVLRTSDPWGRRARRRKGREKWEETFLFQGFIEHLPWARPPSW